MEIKLHEKPIEKNIFSSYLDKKSLFLNKSYLSSKFIPENISHRENEIKQISSVLAPILKGYDVSNIFIYGTCGTGKTICTKSVTSDLEDMSLKYNKKIKIVYINCKMEKVADTEYRMVAEILRSFDEEIPYTGLPLNSLYKRFHHVIDNKEQSVVIILDEIDVLFKKTGDEFLYNLTRINSDLKNSRINIIGITNDISFREKLDLRVKSSLSEEEILFKPYNADQLKDILYDRASESFQDGVFDDGVIEKCAALAAQEHGDARRALDLLRVSAEVAERRNSMRIEICDVDEAENKIDIDRIIETIKAQPSQSKIVLHAIITLFDRNNSNSEWSDRRIMTGDVFNMYKSLSTLLGMKALTQRRISDLIGELDMLGIINTKVISKGRHGRTREISFEVNDTQLSKARNYLSTVFR